MYRLMPSLRAKNVLLMVASLVFYAYGEPVYVLLMIASSLFNYVWALLLRTDSPSRRRTVMVLAVVLVLSGYLVVQLRRGKAVQS